MPFSMDGTTYKATFVEKSLKLKAEIINGDNSGRMQNTKEMFLDYVGTFFNYEAQFVRDNDATDADWDNFFLALCNPINKHTATFPFNQQTMTEYVYVSSVQRGYIRKKGDTNNPHKWEPVITVAFVSTKSMWLAGGNIQYTV